MNKVKAKSGINGMKNSRKFEIKNTVFITNMSVYLIKVPKLDFKLGRLSKPNFDSDFPRAFSRLFRVRKKQYDVQFCYTIKKFQMNLMQLILIVFIHLAWKIM